MFSSRYFNLTTSLKKISFVIGSRKRIESKETPPKPPRPLTVCVDYKCELISFSTSSSRPRRHQQTSRRKENENFRRREKFLIAFALNPSGDACFEFPMPFGYEKYKKIVSGSLRRPIMKLVTRNFTNFPRIHLESHLLMQNSNKKKKL